MRERVIGHTQIAKAYADSEGPDQTAHPRSLIMTFTDRKQNYSGTTECFNGEQMPGCDCDCAG